MKSESLRIMWFVHAGCREVCCGGNEGVLVWWNPTKSCCVNPKFRNPVLPASLPNPPFFSPLLSPLSLAPWLNKPSWPTSYMVLDQEMETSDHKEGRFLLCNDNPPTFTSCCCPVIVILIGVSEKHNVRRTLCQPCARRNQALNRRTEGCAWKVRMGGIEVLEIFKAVVQYI